MNQFADSRKSVMEQVRDIVVSVLRGTSARVYLFGSWARGENHMSSDIDIAVEHDGDVSAEIMMQLKEDLEESTVPYRVDVVDLNFADARLVDAVRREGILWNV